MKGLWLIGLVALAAVTGCSSGPKKPTADGSGVSLARSPRTKLEVVAAENVWGSLAAQLGGDRAHVTSIVTSPDTDPHSYEPTPRDGRALASAKYVVLTGLGYDPWARRALEANPSLGRTTLDVGNLLGLRSGDNPHRWYFPEDVGRVIARMTSDFKRMDPAHSAYFDQQEQQFRSQGLERYNRLISSIRHDYAGTPVGASESIFVGLARATGLELKTPDSFLTAISEGNEPTAQDKTTVDRQISEHQIRVFVYNSQNATPDVRTLVEHARSQGIPVTTVTETLSPATSSFQEWQGRQLQELADALARATGR